jgi:hypothetical protein
VSGAAPAAPRLFDHLDAHRLGAPPVRCDRGTLVGANGWGRMLNDRLRTCAFSAAAHLARCWTSQTGAGPEIDDGAILTAYEVVSGYDRSGPASADVGTTELDALEHWRVRGIGASRVDAYGGIAADAPAQVATVIHRFGGCYVGLDLPATAQSQDVWRVPGSGPAGRGTPGSWLAHAVALVAYDAETVTAVAWGARRSMTWDFLATYAAAAFAVVSTQAWFVGGVPPALDLDGLRAALEEGGRTDRFYRAFTGVP